MRGKDATVTVLLLLYIIKRFELYAMPNRELLLNSYSSYLSYGVSKSFLSSFKLWSMFLQAVFVLCELIFYVSGHLI